MGLPIVLGLGGHPKVTAEGDATLQTLVEQAPREVGYATSTWTWADLAQQLVSTQQSTSTPATPSFSVSAETVRRHLHALGYRVIRPVLTVTSPDPNYAIKVAQLEAYQQQAERDEITLLYEDEYDLNLLPGVLRCWTRLGQQRKIATPRQNEKRYGFGAVNWMTGQVTTLITDRKNSAGFCALLEQVIQTYCPGETWTGRRVILVVDNFKIHASKQSTALLERYADRLQVCPLPTYAPQLNVIERLWKHLRQKVTHNHLFASMAKLIEAVEAFFQYYTQHHAEVLSIIGHSE